MRAAIRTRETFGDLILKIGFQSAACFSSGRCRFCKDYKAVAYYSTRHCICRECCEQKSAELLPRVAKAQRLARRYAKRRDFNADSIAALSGCGVQFARKAIRELRKKQPKYRPCTKNDGKHEFDRIGYADWQKCRHCGEPRFALKASL